MIGIARRLRSLLPPDAALDAAIDAAPAPYTEARR